MTQTVATTSGYTYLLQWEMAGDVQGTTPSVKKLDVLWDGKLVKTATFNITGHSTTSMGWVHVAVSVSPPPARGPPLSSKTPHKAVTTRGRCWIPCRPQLSPRP